MSMYDKDKTNDHTIIKYNYPDYNTIIVCKN